MKDKETELLAARMQSTKPLPTEAELVAERHSQQASLTKPQTQIQAKELQLPFLEASVKQERDEAQQIQMDCRLLPQRSTSLPVHWNGGAAGQPRQWKCQAPSGVQLTEEQRTQLSKAEKSVAEAIAASEATVIARTPFPPQAMDVDEEGRGSSRDHFEGL